jgi:uncharacterized RDD family membrane protein YckC
MDENKEGMVAEYAGFWMRLGAYLIDSIALWIIGVILGVIISLLIIPFVSWQWPMSPDHMPYSYFVGFHPRWFLYPWLLSFLWLIIPAAYFICFWVLRGQTPGMMALRIRLIRTDGSPVDWGAAALRFLGYIVCWITAGLLFLWIAFDSRKQGLHDKMADTYMVILPRKRAVLPETYETG